MPFLIDTTDRPGTASLREEIRPAHLDYLVASTSMLLAAGAKLSDDGKTALGSFYIVDTDSRAGAQAFIDADPFAVAGLFETIVITNWRKGFFNFARQPASGR